MMLKANGHASLHPQGGQLQVSRDQSGGVRVVLAGVGCVLSPREAVGFATALLHYAGEMSFESALGPMRLVPSEPR